MKALSIKQPWAWLICAGYKDVENRTWHAHMPSLLNHPSYAKNVPMRIYVHTGRTMDVEHIGNGGGNEQFILDCLPSEEHGAYLTAKYDLGAIIGEVTITGCVDKSDSPWFEGPYGFTLADPVLYDKPIPYKGRLGFFEVKL